MKYPVRWCSGTMSGGSESSDRTVDRGVSQWNNNAAAVDLFNVNNTSHTKSPVPWS